MIFWKSLVFAMLTGSLLTAGAVDFPGEKPGPASGTREGRTYVLENNLIRAEWTLKDGCLSAPTVRNLSTDEVLQGGDRLFGISLVKQQVDEDWVYVGIRLSHSGTVAVASLDGKSWNTLAELPPVAGAPKLLRVGKTDFKGGEGDHSPAGKMGICEFLEVREWKPNGTTLTLTGNPSRIHKSAHGGTELAINNERGTIQAAGNTTAFSEYKVGTDSTFFSCRIKKGSDTGQTWGPGLTLVFDDGGTVGVGVRAKNSYTVLMSGQQEQIIPLTVTGGLVCDLFSKDFTCGAIQPEKTAAGLVLKAWLTNRLHGLKVLWSAELSHGSNYVRQELTFSGNRALDLYGLQLLEFQAENARQYGQVPGSPVITDSFFTGIEIPVTMNYMEDEGFRSGFGCYLPIAPDSSYRFSSVVGIYPPGQVRRAFNYYLERERATPSAPFLHYNCWYDFAPEDDRFLDVIKTYGKELTKKRGVTLDSFVMDDGWDHYGEGLWSFNRQRFPKGFSRVAREAQKIGSNLGVWISPLGGYSGANERTEHARKMGLIEDQLDLSQPGYYAWYRDKCLEMMRDYNVNYFKWDKAGSGIDPHFMALLRVAEELKREDPDLYLNVTVGTWPSPFWLNHIDCTWRDGSGDVAWYGKGDKREAWLTYRDLYCYRLVVQRAPLYPLNSLMHHGLVLGHHYQGKDVAEAGANLKNAARSYFGSGPNLQELYLSTDLMTPAAWDQVADAVKWNKKNQQILVDSHWVGGDPGQLEVYGWAAWLGDRATLTLRNPNDQEQTITLDVAEVFELPKKAALNWQLQNAYADQEYDAPKLQSGRPYTFTLQPFEVLVFDAAAANEY